MRDEKVTAESIYNIADERFKNCEPVDFTQALSDIVSLYKTGEWGDDYIFMLSVDAMETEVIDENSICLCVWPPQPDNGMDSGSWCFNESRGIEITTQGHKLDEFYFISSSSNEELDNKELYYMADKIIKVVG